MKVMSSPQLNQSDKSADRARLNIEDVARARKLYSLAVDRFPGIPLFPGHPLFEVLSYRSPQGVRVSGGPGNDARLERICSVNFALRGPYRRMTRLTAAAVRAASKPGLYGDGDGLYLQVSAFDTKAWVFRYMIDGRPRKMGLCLSTR